MVSDVGAEVEFLHQVFDATDTRGRRAQAAGP
jgi:hypothetical protein